MYLLHPELKDQEESLKQSLATFRLFGARKHKIPPRMHPGIINYLVHHQLPGDFLQAIIANNLRAAVERADDENIHLLPAYVSFFYNHAPLGSWGSAKAYKKWIEQGEKR